MQERLAEGWQKAKASVPLEEAQPGAEPAAAPAAEPAPLAAEPAPAAEPGADPASEPAAAAAQPAAEPDEYKINFDDTGEAATPESFAEFLKTSPELAQALDANPEMKTKIFSALRNDTENREIRRYVPDVATAKMVTGYAQTFQRLDNAFLAASDPAKVPGFLTEWVKEAMMVDAQGKPIVENGVYKMHPAYTNITQHLFRTGLSVLEKSAEREGNERLQTALKIINETISPSSSAQGELPEELKPLAADLKAQQDQVRKEREELTRQSQTAAQQHRSVAIDRAEDKVADSVRGQLGKVFATAGLTEFESKAALGEIGRMVEEALGVVQPDGNWTQGTEPFAAWYQAEYDRLAAMLPNPQAEAQLSKHIFTHVNMILGKITAGVTRAAKGGAIARQTDKTTKVAAQAAASAVEPRGTSAPSTLPQQQRLGPKELRAKVINDYKQQHNGDEPDANYIQQMMWKHVSSTQAPAPAR
jgi:hypothetical protein